MENYSGSQKERLHTKSRSPARKFRYQTASKFVKKSDTVLDIGCGSEYGRQTLKCKKYIGVDYSDIAKPDIIADLNEWQPDFEFDVFTAFEVIEHIKNTENFVEIAKKAKKHIFISCPASETLSFNPFHIYDFTPEQIKELFEDENWKQKSQVIKKVRYGLQQVHHFEKI